eukprot:1504565-Rhodomonas_salina.1
MVRRSHFMWSSILPPGACSRMAVQTGMYFRSKSMSGLRSSVDAAADGISSSSSSVWYSSSANSSGLALE